MQQPKRRKFGKRRENVALARNRDYRRLHPRRGVFDKGSKVNATLVWLHARAITLAARWCLRRLRLIITPPSPPPALILFSHPPLDHASWHQVIVLSIDKKKRRENPEVRRSADSLSIQESRLANSVRADGKDVPFSSINRPA